MSLATALQPVDWATIDAGLYDWLVAEVPSASVIWANQNIPQPGYPYFSLIRNTSTELGAVPERRYTYDAGQPAGEEIEIESTSMVEFMLEIQAHVDVAAGANDPAVNAVALLHKVRASLGRISVQRTFQDDLCVAIVERMPVQDISLVVNDVWISRASLDLRLRIRTSMTERTGYVESVPVSSTIS